MSFILLFYSWPACLCIWLFRSSLTGLLHPLALMPLFRAPCLQVPELRAKGLC